MGEHLLSRAPFVRITILLILGILIALYFPNSSKTIGYLIVGLFFLALIINKLLSRRYYYVNILFGLIISSVIILSGFLITSYKLDYINNQNDVEGVVFAQVKSNSKYKNNFYKLKLSLLTQKDSITTKILNTNAIAFLKCDTDTFNIQIGDYILLNSQFKDSPPPQNPYQFNYKSFLKYSDISKVGFVDANRWNLIKNDEVNIYRLSENTRQYFISRFNNFDIKSQNLAVIYAIVFGDKSELTPEIGEEFANAGVMHILAVSGLHVGILFLIISFLFKSFAGYKIGKYVRFILILTILWGYAFITGLSPSVVRSVIMFSLVSISIIMQRQHNIYNTVFVSAFILLVFNPFYITKVGFQLSYLAVLGIVFFQPKISKIVKTKNIIIRYLWDLIAVSIAAQISTAPITLFYFSKFPNYFILTNLAVMMLVTFILSISLAFLVLSYIPFLNNWVAKLLDSLLDVMAFIIHKINTFPKAITDNINVDFAQVFLLYFIIISTAYYIAWGHAKSTTILLSTIFIFLFYVSFNNYKTYNNQLVFFNVSQHSIIGAISNNKSYIICDEKYDKLDADFNFNLKKYFIRNNAEEINTIFIDSLNMYESDNICCDSNFLRVNNKTIQFVRRNTQSNSEIKSVDYMVLLEYPKDNFDSILINTNPKELIISNRIPRYFEDEIIETCKELNTNFYLMREKKAKILLLK